jgi:hypothetical protein
VTDAAGFYTDANLSGTRIRERTLDGAECAWCRNFDCLVCFSHDHILSWNALGITDQLKSLAAVSRFRTQLLTHSW